MTVIKYVLLTNRFLLLQDFCAIYYGRPRCYLFSVSSMNFSRSDPEKETQGWGENDRGVSFTFGADVVAKVREKH